MYINILLGGKATCRRHITTAKRKVVVRVQAMLSDKEAISAVQNVSVFQLYSVTFHSKNILLSLDQKPHHWDPSKQDWHQLDFIGERREKQPAGNGADVQPAANFVSSPHHFLTFHSILLFLFFFLFKTTYVPHMFLV